MPEPESRIEILVTQCLDAGDDSYRSELERVCATYPEVAAELRDRINQLERLGFLGAPAEHRSTSAPWLPDRVGRYQLTSLLGRGGMGVVFRGRAEGGPEVAVKIVRPDLIGDDRTRERFRREALLASRLAHPGICPLLEVGEDAGVPFLVMPLLEGETFGAWVQKAHGGRDAMLGHIESFARALHAAHEAGLVHRDVTPRNLFVTVDGRAIVFDFGLARDTSGEIATLTMSHEQLGTLPFMAPEQLGGGARIDCRIDVYALGVVLYEALAGRLPFETKHRSDLSRLIQNGEAPRLGRVAKGLPRPLERVVQRAMDVDPARRYPTALELAEDLQRFRAGQPVLARDVGVVVRARRWSRHHPVATTAILLLGLLLGVAGAFVVALQARVQQQEASEQALDSRRLEQTDPMRAIDLALKAYTKFPSPMTLGQLNRLLHQVNMLATMPVQVGPVRRLAVFRVDDACDRIAVAAESGVSLLLVDRKSGTLREERTIPVPAGVLLRCVRFSPEGRFVAFGGTGKMAFVAKVGEAAVRPLSGSNGEVYDVEVDDAGNVLGIDVSGRLLHWPAGASEAHELLDLAKPPLFPGHETNLRGMRSGPAGDLLLWNDHYALRVRRDGSEVWHAEPVGKDHESSVAVVDGARDRVLLAQLGTMRLLHWSDGKVFWQPELPSKVIDCAIANDGTIASLHQDGTLRFWNDGLHPIAEYRDPHDHLGGVMSAPSADCFLAVGRGGTQMRLDTKGRVERVMAGGDIERWGLPGPFAWSTDGSVLVAGGGPGRVRSWDFDGSRAAPQWRFVTSPPVGISPHPDGERLIVYTQDRQAWLWTPGSKPSLVGAVPLEYLARNQALPGERVVVGGNVGRTGGVAIFEADRAEFRVPFLCKGPYGIVGAATVPGDRLLLAAGDNRFKASLIQRFAAGGTSASFAAANLDSWDVPLAIGTLTCMDASSDGRRVAFGCVGGGVHVWELADSGGTPRVVDSAPTNGRVWSIDMSADGRFVTAGIEDGSVLTWTVDEGDPQFLVKPRGRPARASLADNDHLVIEFAPDGLVRLWDGKQRPAAKVFEVAAGDGAVVRDAVLLRNGAAGGGAAGEGLAAMRLATVSSDGWVRIWSLDEAAVVQAARARLAALGRR